MACMDLLPGLKKLYVAEINVSIESDRDNGLWPSRCSTLSPRRERAKRSARHTRPVGSPRGYHQNRDHSRRARLNGRDNGPRSWLSFVAMRPVSLAAQPNRRSTSALMERRRHQTCCA